MGKKISHLYFVHTLANYISHLNPTNLAKVAKVYQPLAVIEQM